MPKAKRKTSAEKALFSSVSSTPASIRSPLGARKNCMGLEKVFLIVSPFPTCAISKYQYIVPLRVNRFRLSLDIIMSRVGFGMPVFILFLSSHVTFGFFFYFLYLLGFFFGVFWTYDLHSHLTSNPRLNRLGLLIGGASSRYYIICFCRFQNINLSCPYARAHILFS
jgi:hypothetical protein